MSPSQKLDSLLWGVAPFTMRNVCLIGMARQGEGRTCGNMPVVYAFGRRMGYLIMLATTRSHLYCRWDEGPGREEFNIEGSGEGLCFDPDEHFRTGRFDMPPVTVVVCGFLKTLFAREELAWFLCQRAECWMQEKNYQEATLAFAWANELAPHCVKLRRVSGPIHPPPCDVMLANSHVKILIPATFLANPIHPTQVTRHCAKYDRAVYDLRFSSDSKLLLVTGEDFSLHAWDMATGKGRDDSADESDGARGSNSIAVSPDGKRAYVAISPRVQVWDTDTPKLVDTLVLREVKQVKGNAVGSRVDVSPDGKQLAVAVCTNKDSEVQLWDTATLKKVSTLACKERVASVKYSSDGKRLAAGADNRAYLWDTRTEKLLRHLTTTDGDPRAHGGTDTLAVSPSADWIVFGTHNGFMALCPTDEKAGGETRIRGDAAMFSADGKHLFVVSDRDDGLEVWDVAGRKKVANVAVPLTFFNAMTLSPDGKLFAIGYNNGKIVVWDAASMLPKK